MPLNLTRSDGPTTGPDRAPDDSQGWPDKIQPAMDYLKSKHLKGKIGGTMRRELHAGNFGTAAEYLLSEVGWVRKEDLKGSGKLGRQLRDIIDLERDLDGARAMLREATRTGFRSKQLKGRRGEELRELLNAGDREGAVELALNFGHIDKDKLSGRIGGPIRKLVNDDKLSEAVSFPGGMPWSDHAEGFRVKKKWCNGSVGGPLRRALNRNDMPEARRIIKTAARQGIGGPRGSLGEMIQAALKRGDEIEASRLISEAVSHPPQEILKGKVGNLIRHALRDQQPDKAEEFLVNLARRMDSKGISGAFGKQLRRKFNAGDKEGAVQLMYDWLVAKEASHRKKQGAGGAPAAAGGKTWFGPPTATWAAKRAIAAVGRGEAPPEAIAKIRDNGGKGAIAAAFREWGVDKLREYPGIGMVIVYCDFLMEIPGVSDILEALRDKIDEFVEEGVRKGAEAVGDAIDSVL